MPVIIILARAYYVQRAKLIISMYLAVDRKVLNGSVVIVTYC